MKDSMGWVVEEMEVLLCIVSNVGENILGEKLGNRIRDLKKMLDQHNGHCFRPLRL